MAEPETEEKKPLLKQRVSESHLAKKVRTSPMPDWSLLPDELLPLISKNLDDDDDHCFDVVHARSACNLWRSISPFPSSLLRPSYSLPMSGDCPFGNERGLFTLEKVPLFLFRVLTPPTASSSKYFLGGVRKRQHDHMELVPSPIQSSVKVKIPGSDPTLINMADCQILSLGHQYRMIGREPEELAVGYSRVAYLPLKKEGEFVVFIKFIENMFVLTSAEMKWNRFRKLTNDPCKDIVCFNGRFYALFLNGTIFAIDPYSLKSTFLLHSPPYNSCKYLVPCGNDELFLVEKIIPTYGVVNSSRLTCRVSRLDEKAGKWVVVNDLGDRVLFITRDFGNVSCSAKELPDGCGVSGNSILFTNGTQDETFFYKYGVHATGNVDDDLSYLRFSGENRVKILNNSFPVVALKVKC